MSKVKLAALAAALMVAATPALAQDYGWTQNWRQGLYMKGTAGASMNQDQDFSAGGISGDADFDTGWAGTAAVGKDYSNWRMEGEFGYRDNDVDSTSAGGASLTSPGGSVDVTTAMLNGYYDIETGTPFVPYLGAGVGLAHVDVDNYSGGGATIANGDDNVFAYQAIAGTEYRFDERWSGILEYKYFDASNVEVDTPAGDAELDYRNHTVMAGVRYNLN